MESEFHSTSASLEFIKAAVASSSKSSVWRPTTSRSIVSGPSDWFRDYLAKLRERGLELGKSPRVEGVVWAICYCAYTDFGRVYIFKRRRVIFMN
jgi:hypothetical protein